MLSLILILSKISTQSTGNEFGQLTQDIGGCIKGSDTIHFIPCHSISANHISKFTYAHSIFTICPEKQEIHQTQTWVGGDLIDYPRHVTTKTADLTTIKCLLNSVIYTPKAKPAFTDGSNSILPQDTHGVDRIHVISNQSHS